MTVKELNRDVKRLLKAYLKLDRTDLSNYFGAIEKQIKPEFLRLYRADSEMRAFNSNSLLVMIRLNNQCRFIPLHQFGINIDLENIF